MKNISNVNDRCVGCRSCEQVCPKKCITLVPNHEGFLYPRIEEEKCIGCGLCLKACPAEEGAEHRNRPQSVWAFKNNDEKQIMESASGGAADVASEIILGQNGVVYGAAYDENLVVRHIEVTDKASKHRLQSSKYVQSDLNQCYSKAQKALKDGRLVLFTGTPCQIAGLYAYLGGDQPGLYTMDLICHGVPSPKFFAKYLQYQEQKMKGKILQMNFRSKAKRGWGTQYLLRTATETKSKTNILALDRYGKHFMACDCYRECCYQCAYANTDRVGDITVGDFWGILQSHPEFYSEKGVSSVFVNTDKGIQLFEQMRKFAQVIPASIQEGMIKQGNLQHPTVRPPARDSFYESVDTENYIHTLRVGLELKDRLKAAIPSRVLRLMKKMLK